MEIFAHLRLKAPRLPQEQDVARHDWNLIKKQADTLGHDNGVVLKHSIHPEIEQKFARRIKDASQMSAFLIARAHNSSTRFTIAIL